MSDPSVDLVRELLRRFNEEELEAVFELLSADVLVEIPPSLSAEPDVYEGHEGVRRYLDAFEGMLEEVRFEPVELHRAGDQVIADMFLKGRGVASGIEVELRSAVIHWIEDGRVTRMLPCPDLEAARETLRRAA
jgi:ketosteroid isomerase-like protein